MVLGQHGVDAIVKRIGIHRVLVEDDHGEEKDGLHHLAGRTGTKILTEFYGSPDLVGQFVDVKITKAFNRSVEGEII